MSEQATNTLTSENSPGSSPVNVAEIAARHPPSEPEAPKTRGRPRKSRVDSASGAGESAASGQSSGLDPNVQNAALSPLVREQVLSAIKGLIKVIDGRVQSMVEKTSYRLTQDKGFSEQLRADVAMQEIEADTMTTLTVVVLDKYNVLGSYAPEALLACSIIGYSWRVHSTMQDLKKLAREQQASRGLSTQTAPTDSDGTKRNG